MWKTKINDEYVFVSICQPDFQPVGNRIFMHVLHNNKVNTKILLRDTDQVVITEYTE